LILSAKDFVQAMGWETNISPKTAIQRELFPELTEEEKKVAQALQRNPDGLQINVLVVETDIPIQRISALLFELEMKGVVRALAGGVYRLL
jgi:DNA processing protein